MTKTRILQPLPGLQTKFLACSADECLFGGEAGNGKSYALLLAATRYIQYPDYTAVIFRVSYPSLEHLINEARSMYIPLGAKFNQTKHTFIWKNGATIKFRHLGTMSDVFSYQGQQFSFIGFDELCHFTKWVYVYLLSRLRGTNPNIKRMVRSTANPSGTHVEWVKERFPDSLQPLQTAYFKTINGKDTRVDKGTEGAISRAFIPAIRSENTILAEADPDYESRLDQLDEAQKQALKYGKWITTDKPDQLISSHAWEKAINGKNKFIDDNKYSIGADVGTHLGHDKSVEVLGIGNRPYRVRWWTDLKTTKLSQTLAETVRSVAIDDKLSNVRIAVDSIGVGTGVADDLEDNQMIGHILERASHKDPIYDDKLKGAIQFDNLRSQMCWKFKTDMDDGNIDLSAFQTHDPETGNGYFEEFPDLKTEVFFHTYRIHNGKLIVISKEELKKPENLGHSPDFFDALVLWNWVRRMHYYEEPKPETPLTNIKNIDIYSKALFKQLEQEGYDLEEDFDMDLDEDYVDLDEDIDF